MPGVYRFPLLRGGSQIPSGRVSLLPVSNKGSLGSDHSYLDQAEVPDAEVIDFFHNQIVIPPVEGMADERRHHTGATLAALTVDKYRPVIWIRDDLEKLLGLLVRRRAIIH